MTKYLSIAMGNSPSSAQTIFASDDQELVELVVACMLKRLQMLDAQNAPVFAN